MRLFRRRREVKRRALGVNKPHSLKTRKYSRFINIRGQEYQVFNQGKEIVVYKGRKEVFNTAKENKSFIAWKKDVRKRRIRIL